MGCGASSKKKYEEADGGAPPAAKGAPKDAKDAKVKYLSKVPLFQRLPAEDLPALAAAAESVKFKDGKDVIKEGDEGNEFFIIEKGTAEVHQKDNPKVHKLVAGDFFGEKALIRDVPRNATIKASGELEVLKISRDAFVKLGLNDKLVFKNRGAIGGGDEAKVVTKPPSAKNDQDIKLMGKALKANKNISSIIMLTDPVVNSVVNLMWKEKVAKDEHIIEQGDTNADYFYIVASGHFDILLKKEDESQEGAEAMAEKVFTVGPGGSFGELALLYSAPRAATIVATEESIVWVIDRMQFKSTLASSSDELAKGYVAYLDRVETLNPLSPDEKLQLAKALHEMCFGENEYVFKQGENGDLFYILVDGKVSVVKDDKQIAELEATQVEKPFFGEGALMKHEPRAASIKVTSHSAIALAIDKVSFDMLLGPLDELTKRGSGGGKVEKKKADFGGKKFGQIVFKDLKKLGLLGCGGFGAVTMVEHKKSGNTYALKALSKGYIIKTGMQKGVISEKNVQLLCDSPFVVNLYETYNDKSFLYLLLELALGGELYATYNKKHLWGKLECAKFYVAGTTFAFEHLHQRKIVFRDLKPENLLLSDAGQVKLTDLGLAKVIVGKTYTTCGTPDYFAPELLDSRGHSFALDWWTLGILNFELMSGHPPFESATPMQIYQKVSKGIDKVKFPPKFGQPLETLIKGLCHADPTKRLPCKKGGTQNIKSHPWYSGFDWDTMAQSKLTPPYAPVVANKLDKTNFNARKEDMPPQIEYKDPKTGWDADFATGSLE